MKNLFVGAVALLALGGQAIAADMPVKAAPAPVVAPLPTWTGFYIGGHLGGGWSDLDWSRNNLAGLNGFGGSQTAGSFVGGGQAGYNFQFSNNWVLGIEGDVSWLEFSAQNRCGGVLTCEGKPNWLTDVTGRLGYSWPNWWTLGQTMLYVKGGGAWVKNSYEVSSDGLGTVASASRTRSGWTIGVGLEFMAGPNWSAKAEYNYADFGTTSPFPNVALFNIDQKVQTVKFGLNYHFNWATPWVIR